MLHRPGLFRTIVHIFQQVYCVEFLYRGGRTGQINRLFSGAGLRP